MLLSYCKYYMPCPGRSTHLVVWRVWLLKPALPVKPLLYLHCPVRATCFLIKIGDDPHCQCLCFNGGKGQRVTILVCKLTAMQTDEKSHLSYAWQGLRAPEVYLVLFHSPPLNCSYASLQLGHSLKTFTVRSDAIQRLRPLAKRLGIPLCLSVKPNTARE